MSIVDVSIPLLIGNADLKRLGFIIKFEDETVFTIKTFQIFPLEITFKGQLALPLKEEELLDVEIFLMDGCEKEEKKIRKIHQVLAHPLSEILKKFIRNSSENCPEVLRLVDKVNNKCDVCK